MKKTLFLAATLLFAVTLLHAEPESKMEKIFKETFPNATNAKWIKDDNGYLVSFIQNGSVMRICYSNSGRFVSSLRYYHEKDLPTNILLAVKNKYKGKTIFGVTEYTNSNQVIYYIKLYDGKSYSSVKAYSDGTISDDDFAGESDDDNQ
jgi:hypothetical protein